MSATNINVSTLVLTNGAVLTHPGADTVVEHRLLITANTVMISTNSRIDVSARGYLGGLRDGNAANAAGRTLGNTTVGGVCGATAVALRWCWWIWQRGGVRQRGVWIVP
ncbi:MAG: hypothetical protein IPK15_23555 [Verrucomicrobia bacterium]|nr:hypothetical protein [Verrucomicrobiota bacterium]